MNKKLKKAQGVINMSDGTVITHHGTHITIVDKDGNDIKPDSSLMMLVDMKNVKYRSLVRR